MSRRLSLLLIIPLLVLSFLFVPITANVSADDGLIPASIKVAVCHDPEEALGGAALAANLVARIQDGGFEAVPVTYEEVGAGALADGEFDVAYFWGGGAIMGVSGPGTPVGENLKAFVNNGGGLVAHCGAAAAFSQNLKIFFFLRIPALGIIPIDASVEINQLLNMLGRALVSLGSRFVAPVNVAFVNCEGADCPPLLLSDLMNEPSFERDYVWDGGVAYARNPGNGIQVHATVRNYDVHRRFARYNLGRPFFASCEYGAGKVVFGPGSPEIGEDNAKITEILSAEILFVAP